jgi:putative ABC transport system substrate-binding protein
MTTGNRYEATGNRYEATGNRYEATGNRYEATGNSKKVKVIGFALCAMLFALCSSADAQQPTKVPRIGFVSGGNANSPPPLIEAFRQGLRDLGYIEGKNILIEYRYSEGKDDRLPSVVAELMQLKVDVLVSPLQRGIRAAQQATRTIPIVMMITGDPVAFGFVDSLARPGGNVTGVTRMTVELSGKRLELLKEIVPTISRVGNLFDADSTTAAIRLKEYETVARALKITIQLMEVRGPSPDLENVFREGAKGRVTALIASRDPLLIRYSKQIADLAIKNRLPLMSEGSDFVHAGALVSYSANDAENFKRAAYYVDRILKGTKPADLPVEQPAKFEFVINLKTAKALNLTIPQSVLFRADKVIK